METNYTDTIRGFKEKVDSLERKLRSTRAQKANTVVEKNEVENVFVECIEEVRKEIMKRRLKSEI